MSVVSKLFERGCLVFSLSLPNKMYYFEIIPQLLFIKYENVIL